MIDAHTVKGCRNLKTRDPLEGDSKRAQEPDSLDWVQALPPSPDDLPPSALLSSSVKYVHHLQVYASSKTNT